MPSGCAGRLRGGWGEAGFRDLAQHAGKNPSMERIEAGPINEAEKAQRLEDTRLRNREAGGIARDLKFQPSPSRDFHLGHESQPPVGFELFHAPKIQGVSHLKCFRISPTAPQAHTPGKQVEESS